MDVSHALDPRRWRQRFRSEQAVHDEAIASGRAPDATVDEVGKAPPKDGFNGRALPDGLDAGQGTGGSVAGTGLGGF